LEPRPTFATLPAALEFLARALEASDLARLAGACAPLPPGNDDPKLDRLREQSRRWALERLAELHREVDLRIRYAGREFPDAREFKLGGHAKELGHLHIDFERDAAGWRLKDIWICR
jgi:hypothetical protein